MVLGLGRSRKVMWRMVGSHCGVTCGSPAKMGRNDGPPKFAGFPGSQPGCSCFWWIIEGNFAD